MCFHCLSLLITLETALLTGIEHSDIMNTAQTCSEFAGSVCQRLNPGANFFVRQTMKNWSSATRNGKTKITRKASVRFNFKSSACSARNSDIKQRSLLTSERCPRAKPGQGRDERRPGAAQLAAG